jgi:hypothetical protein
MCNHFLWISVTFVRGMMMDICHVLIIA